MTVVPAQRPSVNHAPFADPQDREAVELVAACVQSFEGGIGPNFKDRCERFYRQYRSFSRWRNAWEAAGPNDRDGVVYDAKKSWGANLHIPLSFRTIETMVPRAISQAPHLLYLPRQQEWEDNVDTIRVLIDAQQDQIDIDLPFQAVMRSGRIYGIGVAKTFWRHETGTRTVQRPRTLRPGYVAKRETYTEFDDPDVLDVDVFDFMWDPMGSAMRGPDRSKWVVHRTWLSLGDCLDRLRSGVWATASAQALLADPAHEERLRGMGNGQKYDEVWAARMEASGFTTANFAQRGEQIHEVWEWHDGERVLTVLDRSLLVQDGENPCCGMLPFQIYRPTPLQKQMVGIGDLEPLEHLQHELDTLRSQRRDAGTLALAGGYAYDDSMIDEEDLVFGPAAAIRVRNSGDIRNALMPLQIRDVPSVGWQEEQVIRTDFDVVSGISDQMDPSASASAQTATGAQLAQAALGQRIMLGSRRFEIECVRNVARAFLRLDQRMISGQREIRQPAAGYDLASAQAEGRWQWFKVDPGALEGEFEIRVEGGSMAAPNVPQDRQDAQLALQLSQNPFIDSRRAVLFALKKLGLDRSEAQAWLAQSDPPVPPEALATLAQMGVDQQWIDYAVQQAQQSDPQLAQDQSPDGGPSTDQVAAMMGQGAPQ